MNNNIVANETRISKLRNYLIAVLDELVTSDNYEFNANMLNNKRNSYSLDKIPQASKVSTMINGNEIHQDTFSFRSRNEYSQDTLNNIVNIGFFEKFEEIINSNNNKGILPDIQGIESIECLNCGTMVSATGDIAEFDIQIRIEYIIEIEEE